MGLIQNIKTYLGFNNLNEAIDTMDKKRSIARQVNRRTFRVEISMDKWRAAVMAAENYLMPRREQLYLMYHRVMEDDHLLSQIRTARFNIQMSDYCIRKGNPGSTPVELPEMTDYFDKPWFFKYIGLCVDTEFYGHSLIELMEDGEGMIKESILVPRENVRPEDTLITLYPHDISGINYIEDKYLQKRVVEVGDRDDLGLLKVIAKLVIRKDYTLTDWGIRNEKFGMPYTILRTATADSKELDKKQSMMENFGANMWAILDDADLIDIKEAMSSTGGGHLTFKDYAEFLDAAIAVIVNGQVATAQENAYVGSSEVQERQLNKYTLARMRSIQYHINFNLIPQLIDRGYPLEGCKFYFKDLEKSEGKNKTDGESKEKGSNANTDAKK